MHRRDLIRAGLGFGALTALGLGQVGCQGSSGGKLRVGLLPILDALPMYVAEADGYLKEQGIEVELTLFGSALERDGALQAGQLDLELNDLVSAALLNKDGAKYRVIRLAYRGNPALPMMVLLAAPDTQFRGPADLKGVPVAVSGNTVIEYSTDRLLEAAGLAPADIQKTEVTKIPVRVEMLAKGQVQAATLPEPMASLAVQQGARKLADDGASGVGQSVITARQEVLKDQAAAVRKFLVAYEKGVEAIAASPEKYRALFVEKAKVPEALQSTLPVPPFPKAQVSTREDVSAVMVWMVRKGLLSAELTYEQMVDASFLPSVPLPSGAGR